MGDLFRRQAYEYLGDPPEPRTPERLIKIYPEGSTEHLIQFGPACFGSFWHQQWQQVDENDPFFSGQLGRTETTC